MMRRTFVISDFRFSIANLFRSPKPQFLSADSQTSEEDQAHSGASIGNRQSKIVNESVVHAKYGVGVVFVPDLVHGFVASLARVEPVWAIDHDAVAVADILISMHDAFGNDNSLRIISAHHEGHDPSERWRVWPIVPHAKLEVGRPDKAEKIGLIDMLMRPAGDAGVGRRDVGHSGEEIGSDFVMTK